MIDEYLISDMQDSDNAELIAPILLLDSKLPGRGFRLNVKIVEGEVQVHLSHKWFLFPILLFKADIIEDIIKPLGFRVKRWFRRKTLSAPVYVIEKATNERSE